MNLDLSASQYEFLYSNVKEVLFSGGVGSGKTTAGALWVIRMVQEYPGITGLITANTHSQLTKATLTELFKWLEIFKIPYRFIVNSNVLYINKTKILCYSMEKPENLAGPNVGWWWADEAAFYRQLAFDKGSARVRDKNGPCYIRMTTTPNGFNWLYEHYVHKANEHKKVIMSNTLDNIDNLDEIFVERLRSQYDKKMALQEIDGQFINIDSGQVYYGFDRNQHVKNVELFDSDLLIVGLDFNVHPLCGVFVAKRGQMLYVVDELYLTNSNTFAAAKEILRRYPARYMQVVADETGNRRRTSAAQTDHEILRRSNLDVVDFKNPLVKDRQNNLNRLFDHNYIKIHPRCVELIKDLERLTHENDDEMLGHITDALGYVAWKLNPLQKPRRNARVSYA